MTDRAYHRVSTKRKATFIPASQRRAIIMDMKATIPPPEKAHSHWAAYFFLVCASQNGARMADFSHIRWEDIQVIQDPNSAKKILFMMPRASKTNSAGAKRSKLAMICMENNLKSCCPVEAFNFIKNKMDMSSSGPFYKPNERPGKAARRNTAQFVRLYQSISKKLGFELIPTGHSWRCRKGTKIDLNLIFAT